MSWTPVPPAVRVRTQATRGTSATTAMAGLEARFMIWLLSNERDDSYHRAAPSSVVAHFILVGASTSERRRPTSEARDPTSDVRCLTIAAAPSAAKAVDPIRRGG